MCSPPTKLLGTGTINARGLVSDMDLVFDSTHGLAQTIVFNSLPDQNVTLNLDLSGASGSVGNLGAGYMGNGSISVKQGVSVYSRYGYLGFISRSIGTGTVDGLGSKWDVYDELSIGFYGSGTLSITGGGAANSYFGIIGHYPGSAGVVTVDGSSSTWTNGGGLYVGNYGSGTLNITGGAVVSSRFGSLGVYSGSAGVVTVDGSGSRWTDDGELHIGFFGCGSLSITGRATVSSTWGYIGSNSGSTGTVTVVGPASTWTNTNDLYVGYSGSGRLSITGGATVGNTTGYISYESGSTGTVTVDGQDSTWTNTNDLYVGYSGSGRLSITGGGALSNNIGFIGYESGSTGTGTVEGLGSTWTNGSYLFVGGYYGSGTISIVGGAAVSTGDMVSVNNQSLLAIDVGRGSTLSVGSGGSGFIANEGTVRILAGAGVPADGVYAPIAAGTWSGSGQWQAVGGTWDSDAHQFTASQVVSTTGGTPLTLDLAQCQRALITDSATGWDLGASFLAKSDSGMLLDFTATAITGQALEDLQALAGPQQHVTGAWTFSIGGAGYSTGDPVYLSFEIGAGQVRGDIQVWRYSGTAWSAFDAVDLTYDGSRWVSFTVTTFSGYAVTVPEPAAPTLLLAAGLVGLLIRTWRKHKVDTRSS